MNRQPRLARTCNLDGSEPRTFILPGPQVIAHLIIGPDGKARYELTDYGRDMLDRWQRTKGQFYDALKQHGLQLETENTK